MRRVALIASLFTLAACGGSSSADAGTDAAASCPADPPTAGSSCTGSLQCHWLRCAEGGAVSTSCDGHVWSRAEVPCPVSCEAMTCADGQICAIFQGGARIPMCIDDPCHGGPLEACMCDVCPLAGADRCARSDFTVTCNTCASGTCP
ncbi:MAG: hypothetical protein U0353_05740 [Sandaracinus sp.]